MRTLDLEKTMETKHDEAITCHCAKDKNDCRLVVVIKEVKKN